MTNGSARDDKGTQEEKETREPYPMRPPPILATRLNGSNSLLVKRTAATMLMSTNFTNEFTFAITLNFLIVNTFVIIKFLMQSYDVLEQETTYSLFFVMVICGGYMISVTNKRHL